MARPRKSHDTRRRLLDEGVAAFTVHGFHGTGIKDVLDRVRVPKGSFYNYFASKEAFGVEAIHHYAAANGERFRTALDDAPDALSGLRAYFDGLITEHEENGYGGGCLVANLAAELEGSDLCRAALQVAWAAWRDAVEDALATAQTSGALRQDIPSGEMADLLVDAWEGAVLRMKIERSVAPLRACLARLLDGYFRP